MGAVPRGSAEAPQEGERLKHPTRVRAVGGRERQQPGGERMGWERERL